MVANPKSKEDQLPWIYAFIGSASIHSGMQPFLYSTDGDVTTLDLHSGPSLRRRRTGAPFTLACHRDPWLIRSLAHLILYSATFARSPFNGQTMGSRCSRMQRANAHMRRVCASAFFRAPANRHRGMFRTDRLGFGHCALPRALFS